MKMNLTWDHAYPLGAIGVKLNPEDRAILPPLERLLNQPPDVSLIDPSNNRELKMPVGSIVSITAMDHLSKVTINDKRTLYAKGRLKSLSALEVHGIMRINNSTMLNLAAVKSFRNSAYARLEVVTHDDETFFVSRYYAKRIREGLR